MENVKLPDHLKQRDLSDLDDGEMAWAAADAMWADLDENLWISNCWTAYRFQSAAQDRIHVLWEEERKGFIVSPVADAFWSLSNRKPTDDDSPVILISYLF